MPFSKTTDQHTQEYWTGHFEHFLKSLIEEESSLEARRSRPLRGDVLRQIIVDLVTSPVVVADLTDKNPNVFWELGVRQSFRHGTVTVAEIGTTLPFDIGVKSTLFYCPSDHIKMDEFRGLFKEAIRDCVAHPDRPDSHVLETLTGRGSLFALLHRDEVIRRLNALVSELNENEESIKYAMEVAAHNQKNPKDRSFPAARLRCAATELLVTSRYLDEADSLYESLENHYDNLLLTNEELVKWQEHPDRTDKFLLTVLTQERFLDSIAELRRRIVAAIGTLSSSI
jgi:hypothetical protein